MEKYGFVYIWYDRKRKMFYIGSHWGTEDDGYVCSSDRMRKAYRRRPQDFKRRIIKKVFTNKIELLKEEFNILQLINDDDLGKKYYNLTKHQNGHWSAYPDKVKTLKEKISYKTKEAMQRPEVREKMLKGLESRNNRSSDPEVREKRSQSMKGKNIEKWKWENNIKKAIESNIGKKHTEEHKKKIAEKSKFKDLNIKKVACVHCGKIGNTGNIARWHNDKCKSKVASSAN